MPLDLYLTLIVAVILLIVVMVSGLVSTVSGSLLDMAEDESWNEIIGCAALAVIAAIMLSFFNLNLVNSPIRVSVNITGVLIPVAISLFIIVRERYHLREILVALALVSCFGFGLTRVAGSSVVIDFPLWIIPALVAALAAHLIVSGDVDTREPGGRVRTAAIAYCSGSMGMLIGGDLLRLPQFLDGGSSAFLIGAGGIADFVFLTGVLAIAVAWGGDLIVSLIRRYADQEGHEVLS